MPLRLNEKQVVVSEVQEVVKRSISIIAAEYRGMNAAPMTTLRQKAREANVSLRVVRNTLAIRALEGTEFANLQERLVGPLFLAFSHDAPGAAARVLKDFAKDNETCVVKAISISGKLLDADKLDAIASLPNKEEALGKLLYVAKEPVAQFVRTFKEPVAKLVRTIAAIAEKKKAA